MVDENTRWRNLIDEKHRLGLFFFSVFVEETENDFDFDFGTPVAARDACGDRRATRGDDDGSVGVSASGIRDGVHGCARGAFG